MFGVSSLFHRLSWTPAGALRMGRLDHAMIYALIAGTYAPIGLLVVHPSWRVPLLAIAWGGALIATMAKLVWPKAPIWIAPVVCVALGWLAVVALPQIVDRIGISGLSAPGRWRTCLHGGCRGLCAAPAGPDPRPVRIPRALSCSRVRRRRMSVRGGGVLRVAAGMRRLQPSRRLKTAAGMAFCVSPWRSASWPRGD